MIACVAALKKRLLHSVEPSGELLSVQNSTNKPASQPASQPANSFVVVDTNSFSFCFFVFNAAARARDRRGRPDEAHP